jgi:ABC-2 type transport system permease protein
MSAAEIQAAGPDAEATGQRVPHPVRSSVRFFTAELRLVLLRRRNLLLLAVTAVFPLIIGIALRLAAPHPDGGNAGGPAFFNQLAGNGVFLTFIALSTLLILVLPVVVAVVAGDAVAGEAGYGTLRYLLAVPAGRTRLLAVKYGVIVTFGLCATHWWLSFDALLRAPVDTTTLLHGLLSFAVYAVLFGSFAWARFTSSDITS